MSQKNWGSYVVNLHVLIPSLKDPLHIAITENYVYDFSLLALIPEKRTALKMLVTHHNKSLTDPV